MNIRYSRIISIALVAVIPFLIAGFFVYRYVIPEPDLISGIPVHPGRDIFFASSTIPAIGSVVVALLVQAPLFLMLRSDPITRKTRIVSILTGIALVPILWVAIVVTETWLRSLYFGLWDMNVLGFPAMSTSSLVFGILVSIFILGLSAQPAINLEAA